MDGTDIDPGLARLRRAMDLGATLYMPVVHPAISEVVAGRKVPALRSVVLCLEDALEGARVAEGLTALRALIAGLEPRIPAPGGPGRAPPRTRRGYGPLLFIRPRSLSMARDLAALPGIGLADGLVAPKIAHDTLAGWWEIARATGLALMPTLERPWVFDPGALSEFGAAIEGLELDLLRALRIGGNDLLGALALRRELGRTVYEGPLLSALSQAVCILGARGLPLTAPVFDQLDDIDTLAREAARDAAFGFLAKTAVHPAQIPVIERAFAVPAETLAQAREILAEGARAVFRQGGAMAEPATHRAWAERILVRAASYGIIREGERTGSPRAGAAALTPDLSSGA